MSWCRILDDDGRMWAMVNNHNNCPGGVRTISSDNFNGTLDLMACAADTSVRFTTNGFCPSGFQQLQTGLSLGTSDTSQESLVTLLDAIFVFDVGTCSAVVGASLLMFYISHSAGNIVRWLGRS